MLYSMPWYFALRVEKANVCTACFNLGPLEGNNNHWGCFSGIKLLAHVQYVETVLKLRYGIGEDWRRCRDDRPEASD